MKDDVRPGLPVLWFELEDSIGRAPILGFMNPPHFKTLMDNAATLGSPTEVGLYGARTDALLRPVGHEKIKLHVTIGNEPVNLEFEWTNFWKAFEEV